MSKLRLRLTISLDGYVAGPNQSVDNPMGENARGLHAWAFGLKAWRAQAGMEGGEDNESTAVFAEQTANIGATIMGRNMFGGQPGPWASKDPWNGWWGPKPPFHHQVFVITHHARPDLKLEGGNVFSFVPDITTAFEGAKKAAQGKDIMLGGGASTARQYLKAGLVDEIFLSVAPILIGGGERLFDGLGTEFPGLTHAWSVVAPHVVHMKFARR